MITIASALPQAIFLLLFFYTLLFFLIGCFKTYILYDFIYIFPTKLEAFLYFVWYIS